MNERLLNHIAAAARRERSDALAEALKSARATAEEYSLSPVDEATGQLLSTLAAATTAGSEDAHVVAITPAANVLGLYLLPALPERGLITVINPEAALNNQAKDSFRQAGYSPSRARFLTARPLEVIGRLALDTYHLVFADVSPLDLPTLIEQAWPLLRVGGTLVLADALLDGTLDDSTRTDRDTVTAREVDSSLVDMEGCLVSRLPLGAGLILLTRTR